MNSFKECMGLFTTGVTVVTTYNMQGITINSFCSLSLDPIMILFNLEKAAERFNTSHDCTEFIVSILSKKQLEVSRAFAEINPENWKQYFDQYKNLPIIKEALCYIHCSKHQVYEGGDHKIITSRVHYVKKTLTKNHWSITKANIVS